MQFTELYQGRIYGVIAGLDRIRFRGTERMLSNTNGFRLVLSKLGVLLKDFGKWAQKTTLRLRTSCAKQAQVLGIPVGYLQRSGVDKDALAREIAQEQGIAKNASRSGAQNP